MKKKKNHYGHCHICGKETYLTFEHVPPRAALNDRPAKIYSGVDIVSQQQKGVSPDTVGLRYTNLQQGAGRYTLCSECNNNSGAFYAPHYIDFVNALYYVLETDYIDYRNHQTPAGGPYSKLGLISKRINCLAIFKQIMAMFCSTSKYGAYKDEFREFLINKESIDFDRERWVVSIYINTRPRTGSYGLSKVFFTDDSIFDIAEIITLPLGMVLYDRKSKDSGIEPHLFGCNITEFSKYKYDDMMQVSLELPYNYGSRFMVGLNT